jgi:RNA polymerase sigma-70 factor (ECF subfamily)
MLSGVGVMKEDELRSRFDQQIMPHLNDAYNLARWLVQNEQDAEDVVQEAFLRAFRFFEGFHGDSGKAWLLKIVRNVCWDRLAKRNAQGKSVALDDPSVTLADPAPPPAAAASQKNVVELVRAAIATLPDDFRTVIVLREMQGLSYKEIAEAMNVPVGTVMSRLARARQQLSEFLQKHKDREEI